MRRIFKQNLSLKGGASGLAVMATTFGVLVLMAVIAMVIMSLRYLDLKTNFETKAKAREDAAKIATSEKLQAQFAEAEKVPYEAFVGPDDLGRVAFSYPKTWSVYINKDTQPYEAFLNPRRVHPVSGNNRYALRLVIEDMDYTKVLEKYNELIKKGDLKSSVITLNGQQSTRLDGKFTKQISGSAAIFKIRDKTVTLRTDTGDTHKDQFNKILESLTFNQ